MTQSPFTPTEQKLTVESVRESGRAEERLKFEAIRESGRAEERLKIEAIRESILAEERLKFEAIRESLRAEGPEALLEIARRILGERARDELAQIEGFDALKVALIDRLSAPSS